MYVVLLMLQKKRRRYSIEVLDKYTVIRSSTTKVKRNLNIITVKNKGYVLVKLMMGKEYYPTTYIQSAAAVAYRVPGSH